MQKIGFIVTKQSNVIPNRTHVINAPFVKNEDNFSSDREARYERNMKAYLRRKRARTVQSKKLAMLKRERWWSRWSERWAIRPVTHTASCTSRNTLYFVSVRRGLRMTERQRENIVIGKRALANKFKKTICVSVGAPHWHMPSELSGCVDEMS